MTATQGALFNKSDGKLLTFLLDGREYGIQILEAREVVGMQNIDPVPRTPVFMKGVINLRGKIVPVIDMRLKFDLQPKELDKENCIIVVDLAGILTGIIVDQLVGVITIEPENYESSPQLGKNVNTEFIAGMIKLPQRVIIVLEIEKILNNGEIEKLANL
ncbi:MAG: purine-binding chemotaxis protein CheW [Leptospiraceae bacterium]|nr:purine-binding chemotaxis protein CheW [Leptospiraceae bacterium]